MNQAEFFIDSFSRRIIDERLPQHPPRSSFINPARWIRTRDVRTSMNRISHSSNIWRTAVRVIVRFAPRILAWSRGETETEASRGRIEVCHRITRGRIKYDVMSPQAVIWLRRQQPLRLPALINRYTLFAPLIFRDQSRRHVLPLFRSCRRNFCRFFLFFFLGREK